MKAFILQLRAIARSVVRGCVCYLCRAGTGLKCSEKPRACVRTFCELIVPLIFGLFATSQVQERSASLEEQLSRSDIFAKKCLKLALTGDIEGLQSAVAEMDNNSSALPSMSDDAISVLVDLASKLKKSAPEDPKHPLGNRPQSRSPSLQLLAAPVAVENRSGSSDEEMTNFSRRRRSTGFSYETPFAIPAAFPSPVLGPRILAAIALTKLSLYAQHKEFSLEQYRLLYTEFVDYCRTTCTRYGGCVAFSSFDTIFTTFDSPIDAAAAGLCVAELMRRATTYFRDTAVSETYILHSLTIILQSPTLLGSFGTDQRVHS